MKEKHPEGGLGQNEAMNSNASARGRQRGVRLLNCLNLASSQQHLGNSI